MLTRRPLPLASLIVMSLMAACGGDDGSTADADHDASDDTGAGDTSSDGSGAADTSGDGSGEPDGGDDVEEPDGDDASDGSGAPDTATDTTPDTPSDVAEDTVNDSADDVAPDDSGADSVDGSGSSTHPCALAGGICTAGSCGDGVEIPSASDACGFDDGPGLCCAPPQPEPTGDTCTARGGLCAPIAGCGFVSGYFASAGECSAIGGPSWVCCIPESQCGPSTLECCAPPTVFRSTCDRGEEVCTHIDGTEPVPSGTCLPE